MGSSCIYNKKDPIHNSIASENQDNIFRMQQGVILVYPKQVSEIISSVSSFSSIKSYRSNKNSNQKSHFYQMKSKMKKFIQTKRERESIKSEKYDRKNKCSMEYLIPSPQKDPSKDSSKLLEIQTISLSIPKKNQKNRNSLSSRRIYSKKDLLEKVKQKQRHSVIIKVKDN